MGVIGLGCWNAPVDEQMLAENLLSVREQLKSLPPVDVGDFSRQIEREVELAAARRMDDASRNASPATNAIPIAAEQPAHADDFRSVHWFGTQYSFTPKQAVCIKILWEHWERRTPDVGDQTILELADLSSSRLDAVFRDCTAWGTMIVAGMTRGTHRLQKPTE